MVRLDHVGIPARDAKASAQFLVDILGLSPAETTGPDCEISCVTITDSLSLLFCPMESPAGHHVAFRVDQTTFASVVNRLREGGIAFGNDPDDPTNGQTEDPLGGSGRVYFIDLNGHFFEVMA